MIRAATPDDVPVITEITNALIESTTYEWTETPYSVGERSHWLTQQRQVGNPVLVADDGGTVVGWTSYSDFRDSNRWPGYRFTVEHTIHVDEQCWGRGVGRALIGALADEARSNRKRVMVAGIDSSNAQSVRFHARLGFIEVARMPGVGEKWGNRLDLLLMQRDLEAPFK